MIRETRYGSRTIRFRLERRRVKTLAIRVQPAGLVEVIAPADAEESEICRRVARRGRWVLKLSNARSPVCWPFLCRPRIAVVNPCVTSADSIGSASGTAKPSVSISRVAAWK